MGGDTGGEEDFVEVTDEYLGPDGEDADNADEGSDADEGDETASGERRDDSAR